MEQIIPTWRDFPHFHANDAIESIALNARWTLSDPRKVPVDMWALVHDRVLHGARHLDERCLMTLPELNEHVPSATNNAYYLSAQTDGYVVVDIEPACPPEVRDHLLGLPYLYSETSMSGNGIHLVMPLPDNFEDFPVAAAKTQLKDGNQWYEFLLDHWVTFTRNPVPGHPVVADPEVATTSWEQVWAELAAKAVKTVSVDLDVDDDKPEIPNEDKILELMTRRSYPRAVEDFSGDTSKWEFGAMGSLYNTMSAVLRTTAMRKAHDYGESERVWLLYEASRRVLPWREKHDEYRSGMPWLLYCATSMVSQRVAREQLDD